MIILLYLRDYDGAGFDRIEPAEWDKRLGDWIDLEKLMGGVQTSSILSGQEDLSGYTDI